MAVAAAASSSGTTTADTDTNSFNVASMPLLMPTAAPNWWQLWSSYLMAAAMTFLVVHPLASSLSRLKRGSLPGSLTTTVSPVLATWPASPAVVGYRSSTPVVLGYHSCPPPLLDGGKARHHAQASIMVRATTTDSHRAPAPLPCRLVSRAALTERGER